MQTHTPEIDRLYQDVLSYRRTKSFKKLLTFVKKFPNLAPYNAMLLHIQKPGSVYVASAWQWQTRFGRTIKPGARPLLILKPFGPVAFVYEYNDTEGSPLPDELINPFKIQKEPNGIDLDLLVRNLNAEGIRVIWQNLGTHAGGCLQWCDEQTVLRVPDGRSTAYLSSHHCIVLNENLSLVENYATMLHESGHMFCGHLYHSANSYRWLPERYKIGLTTQQEEFEAETVSWIVCERLGIPNPSASYLSGYLDSNREIPEISIDTVMKAAGFVESLTKGIRPCRKELILKREKEET